MSNLKKFYSTLDVDTKQKIAEYNRSAGQQLFKSKAQLDKQNITTRSNLKNIFKTNNVNFPLIDNTGNILYELVYLGHSGLFLGVIEKEFINHLKNYNNMYSIKINDEVFLRVIDIIRSNMDVVVGSELMILQTTDDKIFNSLVYSPLITPLHYMIAYNAGNNVSTTENYSNIIDLNIELVNNNNIYVQTDKRVNIGAPLIHNNMIIGICIKTSSIQKIFVKLSSYNAWLSQYTGIVLPKITPYTQDELYHIIHQLNHKVMELEAKVNKR